MLSTIKDMITQKRSFQEAADLILENEDLDDTIILTEEPYELPEAPEDETEKLENDDANIEDQSLDDLPTPVSNTTGDPVEIGDDDILSVEIDLATNTPTDILPTPPDSARDAISGDDDLLNQRIDSGFDNDEKDITPQSSDDDLLNEPIEDDVPAENNDNQKNESDDDLMDSPMDDKEESTMLSEAIVLDGNKDDASTDDAAIDDSGDAGTAPDEGQKDSTVTAAVKDKVAELDTEGLEDMDDTDNGEKKTVDKEALLKKLGTLTKGLEDAKKAVMDAMQ